MDPLVLEIDLAVAKMQADGPPGAGAPGKLELQVLRNAMTHAQTARDDEMAKRAELERQTHETVLGKRLQALNCLEEGEKLLMRFVSSEDLLLELHAKVKESEQRNCILNEEVERLRTLLQENDEVYLAKIGLVGKKHAEEILIRLNADCSNVKELVHVQLCGDTFDGMKVSLTRPASRGKELVSWWSEALLRIATTLRDEAAAGNETCARHDGETSDSEL